MSRINRFRIVNLNYNNNAIRIDDELFELMNENTLLSLRNGGGKSVLIQMLTAPFVHKRYRDTSDRPFASYFTTNQPTFIMVEWALDHDAGYVLTGMMVRKNQEVREDESSPELEMVNFIYEYQFENEYDIKYLPISIQDLGRKTLKGFHICKQLFEQCKQDKRLKFDYFDMNNSVRSRAYFSRLEEYQIYFKEWESIIKKVNLKESGLSELFKEAKDEKGLTEKWFLEAVENKLNKENDRMKEFEKILSKYVIQYKANQGNFKRKEGILQFKEIIVPLLDKEHELQSSDLKVRDYEYQIANMIQILEQLSNETIHSKEQLELKLDRLKEQSHRLKYEEHSLRIYELEEEKEKLEKQKQVEIRILEQLTLQLASTKKQKHILEAANRYQTYKRASEDVQRCENELSILKKSNEELVPLQQNIGYSLNLFYEEQVEKQEQALENLRLQLEDLAQNRREVESSLEVKQSDVRAFALQKGRLVTDVHHFDALEERFARLYHEELQRNIEGYYEAGLLEQKSQVLHEAVEKNKKAKRECLKKEQTLQEQVHGYSRILEETNGRLGEVTVNITMTQKELDDLNEQLAKRKDILPYIAWSEEKIFETDNILEELGRKKKNIQERLKHVQREYDSLVEKYKKLESGQVLELPKELEERLKDEGIQYILGMDWLKRNGWSLSDNQALVKNSPFLPYSLILSQVELVKLKQASLDVFTSFPIPIIIREHLDSQEGQDERNGMIDCGEMHFYVLFNDELLDEERLSQLLLLQKREIDLKQNAIETQEKSMAIYDEKISVIKYQGISKKSYEDCQERLRYFITQKEELEKLIAITHENKDNSTKHLKDISNQIAELTNQGQMLERKAKDLIEFSQEYQKYIESLKKLRELEVEVSICEESIDALKESRDSLAIKQELLKDQEREQCNYLKNSKQALMRFSHYTEGTQLSKDVEDLLSEYEAIENKMDHAIKRSEQDLRQAKERFEWEEEQLENLTKRYQLVDADYNQVVYNTFAEAQILNRLEELTQQVEEQKQQINVVDQGLKINEVQQQNSYKDLKTQLNETQVLPKSEVIKRDFSLLLSQVEDSMKKTNNQLKNVSQKLTMLSQEQSSLAEFYHLKSESISEIENKYREYDALEWRNERGSLIRDYKDQLKQVDTLKHLISDELNRLGRLTLFEDEFFKRPLDRLSNTKHEASSFLEQYDVINQVFTSLLKKLDVDIEVSEKEKANVVQLLLDYLQEVHQYLGLIDQNSTITIRGKNIKMLRIKLPDWTLSESLYQVRMNDFIDQLTTRCLELMELNENIEELIGSQVTTKKLYDQIVGTSNVEIKLYKIEEQREYQISWEQVAKNSGGEGFLSAFVILSSLLSFMRRDETDIFSSYSEGKVLLMDNPFAQTNAAHLLKPLIELAKRNNTQLICLSGLGGESIYSRFENIYSLSLVPSSFKKGCEYLKSQHVKGKVEPQLVIPSRIYVEDGVQEALLF